MPVYYRWRQGEFQSVLGSMGIGIDAVVNSQEAKQLIYALYKADLQTKRLMQQKQEEEDRLSNISYFSWLETHLGESLRIFLKFGDRYPILQWFRIYAKDIIFFTLISYWVIWIISRRT